MQRAFFDSNASDGDASDSDASDGNGGHLLYMARLGSERIQTAPIASNASDSDASDGGSGHHLHVASRGPARAQTASPRPPLMAAPLKATLDTSPTWLFLDLHKFRRHFSP
jgi:hypothetical protein